MFGITSQSTNRSTVDKLQRILIFKRFFTFSYGAGFIFTTALPPDKISAALTSLDILKNEEGQMLRQRHQENVKKLRNKLLRQGLPVENCTSHIVPVQVSVSPIVLFYNIF